MLSGQRGITPAFGYGAPHPSARGASTLLNNVLLSTHYGRSDSCPLRRGSARVISRRPPDRLLYEQVSLIHVLGLPTLPSPTTPVAPTSLSHATPQRVGLPPVCLEVWASPVPCRLATHDRPNRVSDCTDWSFTSRCFPHCLATGPRLAASCSYVRLQAGERIPGVDFHLSDQARFQAHKGGAEQAAEKRSPTVILSPSLSS